MFKIVGISMLIGGTLANALAFTGSSYLFSRLPKDNIDAEKRRHDQAIEKLQKTQIEWVHKNKSESTLLTSNLGWKPKQKPNLQN